jgi:dTDP-4-dehydrorhamnose 3,5-epimerase-like enzyme
MDRITDNGFVSDADGLMFDCSNAINILVHVALGFSVLSDIAYFLYKCAGYYNPENDGSVIWNDTDIGIEWPVAEPMLSDKYARAPRLCNIAENNQHVYEAER